MNGAAVFFAEIKTVFVLINIKKYTESPASPSSFQDLLFLEYIKLWLSYCCREVKYLRGGSEFLVMLPAPVVLLPSPIDAEQVSPKMLIMPYFR